jgi:zinc/manganese transport system substrate-binding protein
MLRIIQIIYICSVLCVTISTTFSNNPPRSFHIVVSFSILKDWVDVLIKDLPRDKVTVDVMGVVPLKCDPHVYQPTPRDVKHIFAADLMITLGLSFEAWLDKIVQASETKASLLQVSDAIEANSLPVPDPHVWHDVQKARQMVKSIKVTLCKLLPEVSFYIEKNAADYDKELEALDVQIKKQVMSVPIKQRVVITTHDAFSYYGRAYGITFLAPVGLNTEIEAESKQVARLIDQIKKEKIKAIFFENLSNRDVVKQIAEETGVMVSDEVVLYADSISDRNGPASSYVRMMTHNTNTIMHELEK